LRSGKAVGLNPAVLPPIPTDVCNLSRGERREWAPVFPPGSPNEALWNFKLSRSLAVLGEFRKLMGRIGNHPSRSQWPRGLRHELSSPARKLGSWVRISLEALMSLCVYSVFVLFCVGSGLATG
jgi:hypothetical protein